MIFAGWIATAALSACILLYPIQTAQSLLQQGEASSSSILLTLQRPDSCGRRLLHQEHFDSSSSSSSSTSNSSDGSVTFAGNLSSSGHAPVQPPDSLNADPADDSFNSNSNLTTNSNGSSGSSSSSTLNATSWPDWHVVGSSPTPFESNNNVSNTTLPSQSQPEGHSYASVPNPAISVQEAFLSDAQLAALMLREQLQAIQISGAELGSWQTLFDLHNAYRVRHQANPLTWSNTLAARAASWASRCYFGHDPNRAGGENIYVTTSQDLAATLTNTVQAWYGEVSSYDFSTGTVRADVDPNSMIGHFTQLVWVGSSSIGCSYQMCSGGIINFRPGLIVVCRYYSAGNVLGQFVANVRPASSAPAPAPAPVTTSPGGNRAVLVAQNGQDFTGPGCRNSANTLYWLCVWDNGEALLYQGQTPIWRTRTSGNSSPFRLVVWSTGNIYLNNYYSQFVWQSGTSGRGTGPHKLMLQDDGHLVLYDKFNYRTWSAP